MISQENHSTQKRKVTPKAVSSFRLYFKIIFRINRICAQCAARWDKQSAVSFTALFTYQTLLTKSKKDIKNRNKSRGQAEDDIDRVEYCSHMADLNTSQLTKSIF